MLFIGAYMLLMAEIILEWMMFFSIDITNVVDCCGAIFSTTDATYMAAVLNMPVPILLGIFYTTFVLLLVSYKLKNSYLFSFFNLIFLIISLVSLIAFFGTYIYEQPTHHCPFCILQKDYYYIGYLLYTILFLGTFYGMIIPFTKLKLSLFFDFIYLVLVSYFPLAYYLQNGTLL